MLATERGRWARAPGRWSQAILELLVLLVVANGAPIVAHNLLGRRFDWPIDAGLRLADGGRLLGPSKTVRGVAAALGASALTALLLGLHWSLGAAVGALSMAGDLFSSFTKRRLGRPASSKATVLDQIPEALLPAAVLHGAFGLSWLEVVLVAVLFLVLELALSALAYRVGIRDRPY